MSGQLSDLAAAVAARTREFGPRPPGHAGRQGDALAVAARYPMADDPEG